MKKIVALALVVLLIGNLSFGQSIKKVKITDVLNIADTSTVPVVINFFATWCRPCVQELPWFEMIRSFNSSRIGRDWLRWHQR